MRALSHHYRHFGNSDNHCDDNTANDDDDGDDYKSDEHI